MRTQNQPVIVVGAGIGGLSAALELAAQGIAVVVLEKAQAPGGKMRQVAVGEALIDAGPTVLTMPWVFEELFARAGRSFAAHVRLTPLECLARHGFGDGSRLDLYADVARSADAIGDFAGAREKRGYLQFAARAKEVYTTLERPFLREPCTSPTQLAARLGVAGLPRLMRIDPFRTLNASLKTFFRDPRLIQLFGRYATYCGSSPFQAPATLMLVAHVEQAGVYDVAGGMHSMARALERACRALGVSLRYGETVAEIALERGRVEGVTLASGERVAGTAVMLNADAAALAARVFGDAVRGGAAAMPPAERSLSALTLSVVARAEGFPLVRHNVFFSHDYAAEFRQLFQQQVLPDVPTIYVCAQDRGDGARDEGQAERLFCLINAPATGDRVHLGPQEIEACQHLIVQRLRQFGLSLSPGQPPVVTTPQDFAAMFPGTGGALYGRASHGWKASFQRPQARSRIPGLYLMGGSTHPGPGVPMAALSATLAVRALLTDWASQKQFPTLAIAGGTSTP